METATQTNRLPTWHYLPPIEYGETVQSFGGAPGLRVVFYDKLRSSGMVQYRYLAAVYVGDTMFPLFMVAAESSPCLASEGKGAWALGVFRPEGHGTVDFSADYASWHPFVAAAMNLIEKEFRQPAEGGNRKTGGDGGSLHPGHGAGSLAAFPIPANHAEKS